MLRTRYSKQSLRDVAEGSTLDVSPLIFNYFLTMILGLFSSAVRSCLGEPPEQRWSHIGPSGYTTQYMTRQNRQGRLERLLHWMELKTNRTLPMQLTRMFARARKQVFFPCHYLMCVFL